MILTVLGAGTFRPTVERGCSGYFIESGGDTVLVDAGSGALRQLAFCGKLPSDIDTVFISHRHIDHTGDLMPFLFCRRNERRDGTRDITVYGNPDFNADFSALRKLFGDYIESEVYSVYLRDYTSGPVKIGDIICEPFRMEHSAETFGFRFTSPAGRIAYSADTGICDNLVELCRNADIALIECTVPDGKPVPGHLTPSEAGRAAAEAGCKRVLLTHISPGLDENELLESCRKNFSGKVETARELVPYTV